jgi:hypothetical protein
MVLSLLLLVEPRQSIAAYNELTPNIIPAIAIQTMPDVAIEAIRKTSCLRVRIRTVEGKPETG